MNNDNWIKLTSKKPEHMTSYLTFRPDANFDKRRVQLYKNGRGFDGVYEVTHYQPLPEPPTKGE